MIGTIVIIEDDPMVLEVNKQFVEQLESFIVIGTAETGADGIELVQRLRPDIVLLDIFLPDMDGIQVLKQIRLEEIPTDVILLTAARDNQHVQEGFRYGVIDYLIKPFRFERFRETLERVYFQQRRLRLVDKFNQEELDGWKTGGSSPVTPEVPTMLPKGLNEWTLNQIVSHVKSRSEPESAEEVAEGTGLARVTVRRYLEYMVRLQQVELHVQYGSVGRPVNRYRWR